MTDHDAFSVTSEAAPVGPILRLRGRVDRDAEKTLLHAFDASIAHGAPRVVLDFEDTTYINSSGLAAVVGLLAKAKGGHVAVAARGLTDHYRHIFEITRLSDLIEIEPATTSEPNGG